MLTTAIQIVLGGALLTLGRKLYWLFVGVIGFVAGLYIAGLVFKNGNEWALLLIALAAGAAGILLAHFLQRFALGIAGFVAAAYLAYVILHSFNVAQLWVVMGVCLVSGLLGALLLNALFDWALIILSSLVGAVFVAQALHIDSVFTFLLAALLFFVGVILQSSVMRREGNTKD
jgi:hypothetical protein